MVSRGSTLVYPGTGWSNVHIVLVQVCTCIVYLVQLSTNLCVLVSDFCHILIMEILPLLEETRKDLREKLL